MAGYRGQIADQIREIRSQEGLTTGQPQLAHAKLGKQSG